jgi:FkbM family methyltransferase
MAIEDLNPDHDYAKYYAWKQNGVLLDLGATVGEFGYHFRDKIIETNSVVVCVEPEVTSFIRLRNIMKNYLPNNSLLLNTGVWDKNAFLDFTTTDNPWCNMFDIHKFDLKGAAGHFAKEIYPVLSLDNILEMIGRPVDLLKADIEGAELEVLLNSKLLATHVANIGLAAYHERNGVETGYTLTPILHELGYECFTEQVAFYPSGIRTMLYAEKEL